MSEAVRKKEKVLVGMSGGVDSSLAALLLKEQGYDVVGVTMKIWPQSCFNASGGRENVCCGPKAIQDARNEAETIGVPYYVVNQQKEFEEKVIQNFLEEYHRGRTPIPCVHCNKDLKFGTLFQKAKALGIEKIATGHYARCVYENGRYILKKAKDKRKDQSYYLFSLSQEQLAHILFPLGELTKEEVRAKAKAFHLKTHDKPESQEICFVPDHNYIHFIKERQPDKVKPGPIVDKEGRELGMHQGIQGYTIGQRKGFRIGFGKPVYVIELRPETNTVVVGDQEDLFRSEFWISSAKGFDTMKPPFQALCKIRATHEGAKATIYSESSGKYRVVFDEPQRAITPGQAAVFYDG